MDGTGLDAHLAALGVDDTRAVGANKTRLRLVLERVHDLWRTQRRKLIAVGRADGDTHPDFVQLGDTLRNADNKANLILDGFDDGIRGGGWWHVEDGRIRLNLPYGLASCQHVGSVSGDSVAYLLDGTKDGEPEVGLARLLRRDTTDHASTIRECLFYMESTLISCEMSDQE